MLVDLHPSLEVYTNALSRYQGVPNLYAEEIKELLAEWAGPFKGHSELLDVIHRSDKLTRVFESGQGNSPFVREHFGKFPSWKDWPGLPLTNEECARVADRLIGVGMKPDDKVRLNLSAFNGAIGTHLLDRVISESTDFIVMFHDVGFTRMIMNNMTEDQARMLGEYDLMRVDLLTRAFVSIADEMVVPFESAPKNIREIYSEIYGKARNNGKNGKVFFSLTHPPTPGEAEQENIPYDQFVKLFVDMCDQPWEAISEAQLHLIDMLNNGKHIRFTNNLGTDVSMDLVDDDGRDFTFCNSLIARNLPGSEAFSAPRRTSVNGTIVSRGTFAAPTNPFKAIENLTLHFKDGQLHDFTADKGAKEFLEFLERDPNNRYVGELGIGTNPHLKKHLRNILLTEKIGGSFHLALGDAYTLTDYLGTEVHVNNGNKSGDHWDITTMLYGYEGNIELDGERIMENGMFVDPKLDVLNRGWGAIPREQRPDRWKDDTAPFTDARLNELMAGRSSRSEQKPTLNI